MLAKLTCVVYVALGFIVAAVGIHIVGFLTNVWFTGTSDSSVDDIVEITIGLWEQKTEYRNGTVIEKDSLLNIREEHYIMMAEAGANFLLCFVVLFKHIHVCVGIIAFINMTLLLLSAFYSFVHLEKAKDDLQEIFTEWPTLSLSWSFYFVWVGILVNIIATGAFLTALLIKGEIKATKSSKGLGPPPEVVVEKTNFEEEKVVRVSTVTNDNYGFSAEVDNKYSCNANDGTSYPGSSHEPVVPTVENGASKEDGREKDIVKPEDVEVPNVEEGEPDEPYYISKVNADDAENVEFGFGTLESEFPEIADHVSENSSQNDDIIETSRL